MTTLDPRTEKAKARIRSEARQVMAKADQAMNQADQAILKNPTGPTAGMDHKRSVALHTQMHKVYRNLKLDMLENRPIWQIRLAMTDLRKYLKRLSA